MILRPYQSIAVDRICESVADGAGRGLLVMPTGTGKTATFLAAAKATGLRTLVLAHREELLAQTATAAERAGYERHHIGWIWRDREELGATTLLTVASVQSLHAARRERIVPRCGLVIIDEAHHATADSYRAVLDWARPSYVLGVTATPYRLDGDGLDEIFGDTPIYTYDIRDAIRDGYLVAPRQYAIRSAADLAGVHSRAGDLAPGELSAAVDTPGRNALIARVCRDALGSRRAIVYGASVAHAENLATALRADGLTADWLSGEADQARRHDVLARYRSGEIQYLANCAILTEGFDDPVTSAIVMARPTASRGLYVQCVGRGLRPALGKTDCVIVDVIDQGHKHRLHNAVSSLAGTRREIADEVDCQGREVYAEAERILTEQEDARVIAETYPLEWVAVDRTPRWSREELSLAGYEESAVWQSKSASGKQLDLLRRAGYECAAVLERELTRGEASHLIDRLLTLEAAHPEPATPRQAYRLRTWGYSPEQIERMGKREASRIIGARMGR
jgi:superfamily II DNA or RNA helicase